MSRLIFLTLLLAFIGLTSAQVGQINTPSNEIAIGANVMVTWTYTEQATQIPGILSCIDNTTKNTIILSNAINVSTKTYTWLVNVPASAYYLALNDGSGDNTRTSESSKPTTTPASLSSSATSFTGSSIFGYKFLLSLIMVATVM
ncbi:4140_t:CDS:2, partial [Dentiscutata erythropus]